MFAPAADFTDSVRNFNQWFAYWGDHAIGQSRWGAHFDLHVRRSDALRERQQFLIRPGFNFQFSKNVQGQTAYTRLSSYPFGAAPTNPQFEHRLWHQVTVQRAQGKVLWSHRGRFEHRWLNRRYAAGETGPASTVFEQRARYALRATLPLRGSYSWSLAEETFFPTKPEQHPAVVDQQRAIIGLSKRIHDDLRIEFSYMYQAIWQRNGRIREDNHVLSIAVFNTAPLGHLLRRLR